MKENTNISSYLIISCVHLGTTKTILNVLAQVQKYYKAKVIHLGKIATDEEIKMYNRRINKIKTWDKIDEEDISDSQKKQIKTINKEIAKLESAQTKRVELIQNIFGTDSEFVLNKEQMILMPYEWNKTDMEKTLCPWLKVSSVPPNGERVSFSPITPRSFSYFRKRECSFVIPHPTPVLRSFNKEGLNQAYVMITTGSLRIVQEVNKPNDHHFVSNLPSAVLVIIDNKTGEYHLKRLHFDTMDVQGVTSPSFIADDGLVFTSSNIFELDSKDKTVIVSDEHSPFEHRGVLAATKALVEKHKPELFVNMGDAGDFSSVCRHTKSLPGLVEGKRLIEDLGGMRRLTSEQTSNPCIKRRVMIDSNHPKWLTDFVMTNPCLIGMLDWPSLQKLYWSDWHFVDPLLNEIYKIGDLHVRHGHQESSLSSASDIFVKYIRGHIHSHQEFLRAGSVGAGCSLGMPYLDGNVTAWTNTITSVSTYKGKTSFNIKTVLHNDDLKKSRFAYRNKIIEVDWHKYDGEA